MDETFLTNAHSDDFAQEWEETRKDFDAWLDEQERNYWREIDAKGN